MNSITQNKRYCPHEITTKIKSVKLYRQTKDISFVCRRYHISKASLMRWNKLYDGTRDSLLPKSHRPLTPHPNAHTEEELKWIRDYHRRNPNISISELYGKLREKKSRHNGKYDTPTVLGEKWQMDVKYVPAVCYSGKNEQQFYQYTIIEEASRKRFIFAYEEQSSYSTVDFFKRAITFFGYAPNVIQTDNGIEFTHTSKTSRVHPLDMFCQKYGIIHKLIRPRTPWHRNDQERFYNFLKFYSFHDLQEQMKQYLKRSNNIPMAVLGWVTPNQMHRKLERLSV